MSGIQARGLALHRRLIGSIVLGSVVVAQTSAQSPTLRPWMSSDSVSVRYFVTDQEEPAAWPSPLRPNDAIAWSHDGKYFFFVSHHGDLGSDTNIYDLLVYSVDSVKDWLAEGLGRSLLLPPTRELSLSSASSTKPAMA